MNLIPPVPLPLYPIVKVLGWLWDQRAAVLAIVGFLMWFTEMAQMLVVAGIQSIFSMVLSIDLESLDLTNFGALEFIGVGNAIFPFAEMLSLLVIYYTLWMNLIIFRWVKSFVPTLAN